MIVDLVQGKSYRINVEVEIGLPIKLPEGMQVDVKGKTLIDEKKLELRVLLLWGYRILKLQVLASWDICVKSPWQDGETVCIYYQPNLINL